MTFAALDAPIEHRPQHVELVLASDERRVEAARPPRAHRCHLEHAPGRYRLRFSLERQRRQWLRRHRVADKPVRRLADEDLVGSGSLLEARCDIDGVAGDERLTFRGIARNHLAGVHAGADPELDAPVPPELLVQLGARIADLDRSSYRPVGVVLVQMRHAEDGDDRIADELLRRPAVTVDDRLHALEVTRHEPPK